MKILRFLILREKYIWRNISWGVGAVFLGTIRPRCDYVGDKSYERQFSSGAISRGILSGDNYLCGNFPGEIVREQSSRGRFFLGGRAIFFGGNYPRGAIVRGTIILGSNCLGKLSGEQLPSEAIVLGVIIRGGQLSRHPQSLSRNVFLIIRLLRFYSFYKLKTK